MIKNILFRIDFFNKIIKHKKTNFNPMLLITLLFLHIQGLKKYEMNKLFIITVFLYIIDIFL